MMLVGGDDGTAPVKSSFKDTDYFSLMGPPQFSLSTYHLKKEGDSMPETLRVFSQSHAMHSGLYNLIHVGPTKP
jgi:hypothetical protein